jgi:hypothetical protein
MNKGPSNSQANSEQVSSDQQLEPWQEECQRLSDKILLGLTSKRSDEEWEHYVNRTIQLFAQKGLFKSAEASQAPGQPGQESTATPPTTP